MCLIDFFWYVEKAGKLLGMPILHYEKKNPPPSLIKFKKKSPDEKHFFFMRPYRKKMCVSIIIIISMLQHKLENSTQADLLYLMVGSTLFSHLNSKKIDFHCFWYN